MRKVKVYKNVIDELDVVKEIIKLCDLPMPETGYNLIEISLQEIEYMDADGIFHFAEDVVRNAFEALLFEKDLIKDYFYTKKSFKFAFIKLPAENKLLIQRQS